MWLEYHRQSVNAALKDEQQDLSLNKMTKNVKNLSLTIQEQLDDVDELIRLVEVLQNKPIPVQQANKTKVPSS